MGGVKIIVLASLVKFVMFELPVMFHVVAFSKVTFEMMFDGMDVATGPVSTGPVSVLLEKVALSGVPALWKLSALEPAPVTFTFTLSPISVIEELPNNIPSEFGPDVVICTPLISSL